MLDTLEPRILHIVDICSRFISIRTFLLYVDHFQRLRNAKRLSWYNLWQANSFTALVHYYRKVHPVRLHNPTFPYATNDAFEHFGQRARHDDG